MLTLNRAAILGFVSSQIPAARPNVLDPATLSPASQVLALQLGNVYGESMREAEQ